MSRFQNILVGVDLTRADEITLEALGDATRNAIQNGIWLAEQAEAKLTFFAALPETERDPVAPTADATTTLAFQGSQLLDSLVAQATAKGITASAKLDFGDGSVAIVKQVLRDNHDLVVIGTRNSSRTERFLFGSTGSKLLRNCGCPVWITKPDANQDGEVRILVATDLSEVATDAMHIAVSAGQYVDAFVYVLHAFEYPLSGPMQRTGMREEEIKEYHDRIRLESEEAVAEQLAQTDYRTLERGVQLHVVEGKAEVVIPDFINEHKIDLLVMGTLARTGIPGMLIGNTAERLLPLVECSVLTVKPTDFVSPITL